MHSFPLRRPKLRVSAFAQRDGTVRLGWDPDVSFVVAGPPDMDAEVLLNVLRQLDGTSSRAHIIWFAGTLGVSANTMSTLLSELDESDLLVEGSTPNETSSSDKLARPAAVHLVGRGPLGDAIRSGITTSSALELRHSNYPPVELLRHNEGHWQSDLTVLSDDLVPDPLVVTALVMTKTPHLQVRLREGKGIVGPLVIPGESSCLRCLELERCTMDPQWPHVSAQLLGRVGEADRPTVLATAAVVLAQIEGFVHRRATQLTDSTLEIDLDRHRMDTRRWARHALCDCAFV
ncbi:hypothetical protein [Rhodococcoides yunnanense]|uniref:hypothetical protein n=1 Tax=Rhodococcoides yunnanense TaxID=278209 RepID=UPI0009333CA0|nr:hypothetical protein [Rhodococcus yunnanensis]